MQTPARMFGRAYFQYVIPYRRQIGKFISTSLTQSFR